MLTAGGRLLSSARVGGGGCPSLCALDGCALAVAVACVCCDEHITDNYV